MLQGDAFTFVAVLIGIIVLAVALQRDPSSYVRTLFLGVFGLYLITVLAITMFPIPLEGSGQPIRDISINLLPGRGLLTPGNATREQAMANLLLGVPFGYLGFLVIPRPSVKRVLLLGFGTFVGVELVQLILTLVAPRAPRTTDISDVILNTLGVGVGVVLFLGFAQLFRSMDSTGRLGDSDAVVYIRDVVAEAAQE